MKKLITLILFISIAFQFSPAKADNDTIVFIGDSITFGAWSINPDGTQLTGIPVSQKFSTLIGQAHGFSTIINKGKPNDTVAGLQARLQTDVISYNPDMVVIMIGRNDVNDASYSVLTPVSTYKQKLGEVVQTLQSNGINRILILSPNVMNHGYYLNTNIIPYLDAMAQVAQESGVHYIDVFSMWASYKWSAAATVAEYDALYYNNTHPSAAGHAVIAEFVNKPQFNYMFDDVAPTTTPTLPPTSTPTIEPSPTETLPACVPDPDLVDPDVISDAFNEWIRSLPK